MQDEYVYEQTQSVGLDEVLREFRTEIKATPSFESHDVLINAIKDSERYFPERLSRLVSLKDPNISLANFSEREVALIKAAIAKLELIELSRIPRWRKDELRQAIEDFELLKIYVESHLSRAKKGHFLDKVTQISKVISYQTNMPAMPRRRRLFPFFGGEY
jgi:hypothetical protein